MSDDNLTSLEAWRRLRASRRAKERRQEMRCKPKPKPSRPGGNAPTLEAIFGHPDVLLPGDPDRKHAPPRYVPQNTHTPGSIAYALLYTYWKPK
jgi:hypothetical protein